MCILPYRCFSPSDVHKQILCSLVYVEDFIPEQAEAGGALQSQFPQRQRCRVAVKHRMTQDESNWRGNREEYVTKLIGPGMNTEAPNPCFNCTYKQSTSPLCPVTGIHTASADRDRRKI